MNDAFFEFDLQKNSEWIPKPSAFSARIPSKSF